MSRAKISIGAEIARLPIPVDLPISVRPVSVSKGGDTFNARCYFRVANGRAVYSIGECSDAAFNAICDAFDNVGAFRLATRLVSSTH